MNFGAHTDNRQLVIRLLHAKRASEESSVEIRDVRIDEQIWPVEQVQNTAGLHGELHLSD